jgi:hypothetical protein
MSEHAFYVKQPFFFTESGAVDEIEGKYGRAGQDTDDIIRRMLCACWITEGTDTHSDYASFFSWRKSARASLLPRIHDPRHTPLGRTPLDQ